MIKRFRFVPLAMLLVASTQFNARAAGSDDPTQWHGWIGYSGIGGDVSDIAKDGWSLGFGVLYTPPKGVIQVRGDLGYDFWDIKTGDIPTGEVHIDDGDASSFSFRAGVQAGTDRDGFNFYGGVGIGGYYLRAQLTETALIPGTICDPWWGYCYPAVVEGDVILADDSTTKFGYYAMIGGSFEVGAGEMFIEATYHWVQTQQSVEYYPIVLGFRW